MDLPSSGSITPAEIQAAWRKAIRTGHADRNGDHNLAADINEAREILLHTKEVPTWKTGKGGRPPLISDLQPDNYYGPSDLQKFVNLLVQTVQAGPTRILTRLDFRGLSSTFVQIHEGKCIYTHPNVGPKTTTPADPEALAFWTRSLGEISPDQILTIRFPRLWPSNRDRAWILWKTGIRKYHSLDFCREKQ